MTSFWPITSYLVAYLATVCNCVIYLSFTQHDPAGSCSPGGSAGNFIMFRSATDGQRNNNKMFSTCSMNSIRPVLQTKSTCFECKCWSLNREHLVNVVLYLCSSFHCYHRCYILLVLGLGNAVLGYYGTSMCCADMEQFFIKHLYTDCYQEIPYSGKLSWIGRLYWLNYCLIYVHVGTFWILTCYLQQHYKGGQERFPTHN